MTSRDLRRLRRVDLLELLVEQSRENENLKAELEQVRAELERRPIAVDDNGSLAGAAAGARAIIAQAEAEAQRIVEEAHQSTAAAESESAAILSRTQAKCDALRAKTRDNCIDLLHQAEAVVEAMFAAASDGLGKYAAEAGGFKEACELAANISVGAAKGSEGEEGVCADAQAGRTPRGEAAFAGGAAPADQAKGA